MRQRRCRSYGCCRRERVKVPCPCFPFGKGVLVRDGARSIVAGGQRSICSPFSPLSLPLPLRLRPNDSSVKRKLQIGKLVLQKPLVGIRRCFTHVCLEPWSTRESRAEVRPTCDLSRWQQGRRRCSMRAIPFFSHDTTCYGHCVLARVCRCVSVCEKEGKMLRRLSLCLCRDQVLDSRMA